MISFTQHMGAHRPARLLAACALAGLLLACGNEDTASRPEAGSPVEVRVATVEAMESEDRIRVAGVVSPAIRAQLSTRQAGTVEATFATVGEQVKAGQEILRIDARDLLARRDAAVSQWQAARAALEQAVRNRDRFSRLYQQDLVAKIRLEDAELAAEQAAGRMERAQSELAAVEMNIEYTRLRAPFDGVISEIIVEVGAFASPGMPLLVLEDRSRLKVDAGVHQESIGTLPPGERVPVRVNGIAESFTGRVQALLPALGQGSSGLRLRLEIEQPPPELVPGMIAEVLLPPLRDAEPQARVPVDALLRRGQLTGVFVVAADEEGALRARIRWVTLEGDAGGKTTVQVKRGLRPGERVVVGGSVERLADDQAVVLGD